MLRNSATRTSRCVSKACRSNAVRPMNARPASQSQIPLPTASLINPIDLLLSKGPLGWPTNLTEASFHLDAAPKGLAKAALKSSAQQNTSLSKPTEPEVLAILADLYKALNSSEVQHTVNAYVRLKAQGALEKISEADIIKITQVLLNFLERCPLCALRTDAEDMAVYFAARGSMDPLNSAMAFHLRENNPRTVCTLWHSYIHEKAGQSQNFMITKQKHGQDHALLYFAAAASIEDDYQSVATAVCTSTTIIPSWKVHEFANEHLLDKPPLIRQRFRDFLHDASLSRDIRYFKPLFDEVVELGTLSDSSAIKSLYYSIKDGLDRGIFVVSPASTNKSSEPFVPQRIDIKVWSLLIRGALETRNTKLVELLVEEMISYGAQPNLDIWNNLLYGYGKQGRIPEMMKVVEMIQAAGLKPNLQSLSIVMTAFFDSRQPTKALDVFESIQRYPVTPEDERDLLSAYNSCLNGLLRSQLVVEAHELLRRMQENGPQPDIVTFNTFLNRHMNMKDRPGTAHALRAIADAGLKPDIYTFTILYVGASRNKDEQMKTEILNRMKSLEIKANRALLTAAIHSILNSLSKDAIQIAFQLLDKMEQDPDRNVKPNEITYSAIMNAIEQMSEKDRLSIDAAYNHITTLYQRMLAKGFRPNRRILHLLMKIHLRYPVTESLETAMAIFDDILEGDMATSDTWYILLQGLERRKEFGLAKEKARECMGSRLEPRGSLLILLDRIDQY